jgi:hypothetical protein
LEKETFGEPLIKEEKNFRVAKTLNKMLKEINKTVRKIINTHKDDNTLVNFATLPFFNI